MIEGDLENVNEDDIQTLLKILDEIPDTDDNVDYNMIMDMYGLDVKELEEDMENYTPTIDLQFMKW